MDTNPLAIEINNKVQAELVDRLYQPVNFTFLASFMVATVLCAMLYGTVKSELLITWYGLSALILGIRYIFALRYWRRDPKKYSSEYWKHLFRTGASLSGIMWGCTPVFLMPQHNILQQAFVVMIIAGMSAAATQSLATDRSSFRLYISVVLIPVITWLFLQTESLYLAFGAITSVYTLFLVLTSNRNYESIKKSLYLQFENIALTEAASASKTQLEKVNQELTYLNETLDQRVKERTRDLLYQATHDMLTGLPNKTSLFDRIQNAISYTSYSHLLTAILFFDLDRFKYVNDSLGHHAGDMLLQSAATRLHNVMRKSDVVARLGGDEFVVALTFLERREDVIPLAEKFLSVLAEPFHIGERELTISSSLGISIYPYDGPDIDTLLKNADTAMYQAKAAGRNNFQFYSREMNERAVERLELENYLHHALERNELLLHYQPLADNASGNIIGVEALIRWHHPKFGLISPNDFIPLAEETGLILSIGEWVLRTACKQAKAWQDMGIAPTRVAVNLSIHQVKRTDLVALISEIIAENQLDPSYLELEFTENILIENSPAILATMHQLKTMGLILTIDDFGTGYSSLGYLSKFPFEKLKIDGSFIQKILSHEDAAIVQAILAMAKNLHLHTVAEGVETEEQLHFLQQHHCDEIQGYYFSPPLNVEECTRLLQSGRRLPNLQKKSFKELD